MQKSFQSLTLSASPEYNQIIFLSFSLQYFCNNHTIKKYSTMRKDILHLVNLPELPPAAF